MFLPTKDVGLFFNLHRSLMFFVNQRLQVIPDRPANPDEYSSLPPSTRFKVHEALLRHTDLIQAFVDENPAQLPQDQLDIVVSWRHLVHGKFFVFRELTKYTVFLSTEKPPVAYGVLALTQPFEVLIGPHRPVMVEAVLLPFKNQIIYDGLMSTFSISFGPGVRRTLNEDFKAAKARHGIVTSLPMSATPMPAKAPKARPVPKPPSKADTAEVLRVIVGMIDGFCRENLNDEYALLCRELAEKLARKRPSPLLSGSPNTWASGIVRTVGWVNFLQDKTQTPHMRLSDIDARFGISESSGAAKLAAIRKMLKIHQFDPNWTLPSRMDDNPMAWMIQVNGFMMDVRHASREVQEIAFKKGLIPYIPADRRQGARASATNETSENRSSKTDRHSGNSPAMPEPLRKISEIMKEMSERLLRDSAGVPSSEAAHVALMFANIAWNEAVGLVHAREGYRSAWEQIEADNPELWNEFKSNDVEAIIDDLIRFKEQYYPDDLRRILTCGISDGKVRVEWLGAAAPGVDSKWEMRLYGLVRTGEREKAIQFLQETRGMSRTEAVKKVVTVAVELGTR